MDSNMFDDAYSHGTDNEGQTLSSGSYNSSRKRGPSKGPPSLPDGKKRSILTNEFGQPNEVDENTSALSGSIGIQTRELLPIIYNEFSDIPDGCYQRVLDALEAKEKNLKSDAEVGRSEVYIRAHTKKDKTVQCPEIIEKIENIVKSNPEASKTSLNDALSQTLGKDSRGHMRGLGAGVSMTLFKSSSHIVEKNINLQMENNTTISMVEKLQRDMQELKDAFKKIQSTPHTGSNTSSPCSVGPVTQSILTQRLDTCNIGKACKAYSWPHVEVAEGEIVEVDPEVLVHHVAMEEGNYKIWLTRILDEKALLFKGDANVRTLEDVGRGGYLVWPKNFLEIET